MKKIWITWEKQRRNAGISSGIGAEFFELTSSRKGVLRYIELSKVTFEIISKTRPDIVFVQNPSIILSLLAILCSRIYRYTTIIDAHNSGIYPYDSRYLLLNVLSKYLQKKAFMTIVTNYNLCLHVANNGGRGFVLPDRVPKPPQTKQINLEGNKKIVFICTFSSDEPYLEVIKAAKKLENEYKIYFTGNSRGKVDLEALPKNVEMLGYIPDEAYWNTLYSADAIMDLTTREDCLVCGAYEGLSLEKPLILSNTGINKEFFNIGCVYVDSNSKSIHEGILECFYKYREHQTQIVSLKKKLEQEWEQKCSELLIELTT